MFRDQYCTPFWGLKLLHRSKLTILTNCRRKIFDFDQISEKRKHYRISTEISASHAKFAKCYKFLFFTNAFYFISMNDPARGEALQLR